MLLRRLHPSDSGSTPPGDPAKDTKPPTTDGAKPADKPADKADDPRVSEARQEAISERKKRQELDGEIKKLKAEQEDQRKRLAVALGLKADDDPAAAMKQAREERDSALSQGKSALLRAAVITAAAEKGVVDPGAVFLLGDFSDAKVDLATGKVEGIDEIIKGVLKDKPYLVAKPAAAPKGGAPANSDPKPEEGKKDELIAIYKKAKAGDQIAIQVVTRRIGEFRALGIDVTKI